MARQIFLDIETTGLDVEIEQITEIAWICDDGTERQFFVEHTRLPHEWVLTKTDYLTRIVNAKPKISVASALYQLNRDCRAMAEAHAWHPLPDDKDGGFRGHTRDDSKVEPVYLVGACPAFDDRFLRRACHASGQTVPYNYHVVDIEAVAMGALGHDAPCRLKELRAALGIEGENPAAHTALSDAREVKIIWDALRRRAGT